MGKGLKQLVSEALADEPVIQPVEVSGEAVRALSEKMREWSGWTDARLLFGTPTASPFAECRHDTHTFVASAERLVLNPHRVLLSVTPFRLRQEAVLTGALLHEAGHARHSLWKPRTAEQAAAKPMLHSDGEVPTKQAVALATVMEEARIEGLMARDADHIGAAGLGWTMRASAAHLVPTTSLSNHAGQAVMDLITSWALRAGRQIAFNHHAHIPLRSWVQDFTTLLHSTLKQHLIDADVDDPDGDSRTVLDLLLSMIRNEDDRGPSMIDYARGILTILFPETDGNSDDAPMPEGGCSAVPQEDEQSDEEQDSEPEEGDQSDDSDASDSSDDSGDSGEEDESGDEEAEQEDGEGEDQSEGDEPGDGGSDTEDSPDEEGDDSDQGAGGAEGDGEEEADDQSDLAKALAAMEQQAKDETEAQTEAESEAPMPAPPSDEEDGEKSTGDANMGGWGGGWRQPTADERELQHGAERFLRDLIDTSESAKVSLTDTPSATVDGAALAAWRAGGGQHDPRFFMRTKREVQPSPPVKIAILVDVSGSMEELQKPSSVLSWALAAAALDLRNFAGRGQQIESTLIHWGSNARVIQRNGEMMPGIKEDPCMEGTYAMHEAHDLVAEQIPGFFDYTETPVNRLLVHFTDWELALRSTPQVTGQIKQALAAGVNLLTIVPRDYSERRSDLPNILSQCDVQRGATSLLKYNRLSPEHVWQQASETLSGVQTGTRPAPFAGF